MLPISNCETHIHGLWQLEGREGVFIHLAALYWLDADTTAGQVGALLEVILGESGIPAKWKDPLGDRVETYAEGYEKMKISELTERTIKIRNQFYR